MIFFNFFKQEQQHKFDNEHKDRLAQELAFAHEKMRTLTATTDSLHNSNKQLEVSQKRPTIEAKETYYSSIRDLLNNANTHLTHPVMPT
jgi:hypothetical protein